MQKKEAFLKVFDPVSFYAVLCSNILIVLTFIFALPLIYEISIKVLLSLVIPNELAQSENFKRKNQISVNFVFFRRKNWTGIISA